MTTSGKAFSVCCFIVAAAMALVIILATTHWPTQEERDMVRKYQEQREKDREAIELVEQRRERLREALHRAEVERRARELDPAGAALFDEKRP
jgi:type I site-specific restriction endonuclease